MIPRELLQEATRARFGKRERRTPRPSEAGEPAAIYNVSRRELLAQLGLTASGLVLGLSACGDDDGDGGGEETGLDAGMPDAAGADAGDGDGDADAGGPDAGGADAGTTRPESFTELDTFVSIGDDGTIQIVVARSEMGQGVRTSCAMLVAEELRVAWQDVAVVQAIGHPRYGDQNTDASASIRDQFEPLRQAGAAAREMLVAAAAERLGVDADELSVEDSHVVHGDERLAFGELVGAAADMDVPAAPALTDPADFRIIGQPTRGIDVADIVTGRAVFGADVELDGMVYASLERSPTLGGTIDSYDADAAMAVPGVTDVIELDADAMGQYTNAAVAVIAENTSAAIRGRAALGITWNTQGELEQTDDHRAMVRAAATGEGTAARTEGDFAAAEAAAARVFEAEYESPYLAHSPMEPPVALADVRDGEADVWAPTQDPQRAREEVAALLGIDEERVTIHVTLLGGGFGRKSQPDFILEAVTLSERRGQPVRVQWTREDEVRHGFYRPEACQRLRATLDDAGEVTGLAGQSAFSTVAKAVVPGLVDPLPFELDQGWTNLPFQVPNQRMSWRGVPSGMRIGWWRSVANTFHAFAVGSFLDELAQELRTDAVALFRQLVGDPREFVPQGGGGYTYDTGRMLEVVDRVTAMGTWGSDLPAGEGVGFAAHMSFQSYTAVVVHVAVDTDKRVSVQQVDYAVDCGRVVNPDGVRAQVEGGFVYGLTAALFGEISVQDGAVVESNFDSYPIARIQHMPPMNVEILDSDAAPTGIGEPPTPVVAPALANAIFAATGERVRALPILRSGFIA